MQWEEPFLPSIPGVPRDELLFQTLNCRSDLSSDTVVSQPWAETNGAPKRDPDTAPTGTPVMNRIDIEGPTQVHGNNLHPEVQSHEADSPFEFLQLAIGRAVSFRIYQRAESTVHQITGVS